MLRDARDRGREVDDERTFDHVAEVQNAGHPRPVLRVANQVPGVDVVVDDLRRLLRQRREQVLAYPAQRRLAALGQVRRKMTSPQPG